MTNDKKPTPIPWKAEGYYIRQPMGRMIAYTGPHHTLSDKYPNSCRLEDEANAAYIVKCANAHESLVKALEAYKAWSKNQMPCMDDYLYDDLIECHELGEAALKKAQVTT